jgi:hypothetical protein
VEEKVSGGDPQERKAKPTRFVLGLSDDLLIAIGTVSANWAALEYYLVRTTRVCWERFGNTPPGEPKNQNFVETRNAFLASMPDSLKKAGSELVERIKAAENKRHKLIHGMASEDTDELGDPLPLGDESVRFQRDHPKHYFTEHMSVTQVRDVADEIADINGDLFELYLRASGILLA